MAAFRSHGKGTLVLKGTFAGIRIERASGTNDAKRVRDLRHMCRTLADSGRLDILRELAAGRIRLLQVWEHYRGGDWTQLPTAEHARPLADTFEAWRLTVPGERHRADLALAGAAFARPYATLASLPAIVAQLRETFAARGRGRQFNKLRDAASAFLKQTLTRQHALYRAVRAIDALPVTRKLGRHPQPPAAAWLIAAQLGGEAGRIWWVLCCSGMGPKEFWEDGWALEDQYLHVFGQKRAGRDRLLPLILEQLEPPTMSEGAFRQRLKKAKLGVTPYDARRSFAVWLEQAGILPSHQDAYLGHGPRTMGDLYRQHTILVDQLDADRDRLSRYVNGGISGGIGKGVSRDDAVRRLGIEPRTYGLKGGSSTSQNSLNSNPDDELSDPEERR